MQANLKTSKLASLHSLAGNEAQNELLKCCGSKRWAERMSAERPFETVDDLIKQADLVWRSRIQDPRADSGRPDNGPILTVIIDRGGAALRKLATPLSYTSQIISRKKMSR